MKRRAHFIWTPDQPIDHDAYFRLVSREPLRREDGVNRWMMFRKKFHLPSKPDVSGVKITCDGRYQLFVNGARTARGPARASPHYMRVDDVDICDQLQNGENILAILVHTPGVDLAWYETTKGAWQPVFGDGGLYVDLTAEYEDTAVSVLSDQSWRCSEATAWNRDAPRSGWGQDFIEDLDASRIPDGWQELDFDDTEWQAAQCMISRGSPGDVATGRGGHEPFPTLLAREIPHLAEHTAAPARVVWTRGVNPRPELPLDRQLYDEELCDASDGMFQTIDGFVDHENGAPIIRTQNGKDAAIMLTFDPYITGYPFIDIEAKGGEVIEVAAAEALPGEFTGEENARSGLKRPDHLTGAHLFRYRARPGRQQFEKFEWTAVRALQINIRNAPDGVKIHKIGVTTTNYPARFDGAFECSDPLLNDLWRVGRHTALQCMHDAYEDCPGREKRQWVGDGVIHFDIAAAAFGPSAYPLGRQFLQHAAESQRSDGLIHMFAPGDHRGDGVIIPDFSLHWVRGVANYWLASGDTDLAEQLFPTIEKVLQWFGQRVGDSNLLTDIPYWHFIEWAHVDRSGASAPINALYAAALQSASRLAEAINYPGAAKRYQEMSVRIADALNARHWNERRRAYVDSVDPQSGAQGERISQQSNALMIAFDIAPKVRWAEIIKTISNDETLKFTAAPPIFVDAPPYNEATDIVRANTFFCHFLYEAFAKANRVDLALAHMHDYYQPMLEAGATTLWESFEPSASLCHVFSATPVYQLSRHVLGISPIEPGFKKVRVTPQFGDLDWAAGAYPTPLGAVNVKWRRDRDKVDMRLDAPASMEIEVTPPSGVWILRQNESQNGDRRMIEIEFS